MLSHMVVTKTKWQSFQHDRTSVFSVCKSRREPKILPSVTYLSLAWGGQAILMDSFTMTVGNGREEVPKREAGGGGYDQKAQRRIWMDNTADVHFSLQRHFFSGFQT